ncbi:tail fiber assembly protein [Pseudomonas sp. NPDC098747]|uniref:tail fiber assembly protein n=1 Tax=Pseudomonas sp. NPDC098747 TaxID=3364487 RepID=UPI00383A04D3
MVITKVRNPQWANAEKTAINVSMTVEGLGEIPFTASPDDTTDYGPKIFERAVAGEFGEVADMAPIPDEVLITRAIYQQRRKLAEAAISLASLQDAVDLGQASGEQVERLTQWKQYRIDLSKIAEQAGWPGVIDWPVPPNQ